MIPSIKPRQDASLVKRVAEIDFVGTILLVGFYLSGLMAISFGGVLYAWGSGQTIANFVAAGVLIVAFLVQQSYALFHYSFFKVPPFWLFSSSNVARRPLRMFRYISFRSISNLSNRTLRSWLV